VVGGVWELINNKLYGVTNFQGANGLGTIFSFDLGTNTFTVLHNNDALTGYWDGPLLNVGGGLSYLSKFQNSTNQFKSRTLSLFQNCIAFLPLYIIYNSKKHRERKMRNYVFGFLL
jgi:uncharacterized repeat protein (TIGR03803 family)